MQRDHRLGVRLAALVAAIAEDPREGAGELAELAARLQDVVHLECRARLRELKRLWAPFDPNPEGIPRPPGATQQGLDACWSALGELLERANYVPVSHEELERALARQSVFPLALHTRLDEFADLRLWRRGLLERTETVPRWFGLRKRKVVVQSFERVVVAVRFRDPDYFPEKRRARLPFAPGETTIKLFQDVPVHDLEMLFPNTSIKMRWVDHLALWLPAFVGGIGVLAKSLGPLMVVSGIIWLRVNQGGGTRSLQPEEWAALGLAGSAAVAIVLFSIRQLSRFRARKIAFLQLLTRSLYFRSLDNNAGVFHRVLDSAEEEDSAEAILAYVQLRWQGPQTRDELDASIEAWMKARFGLDVDFDAEDGLAKLERFGLASEVEGRWSALAPADARTRLEQRWVEG